MSEVAELLLEDGPEHKRLRVALKEFKGIPLLDIRYWYKDKKTGEIRPTGKGISLTRANYLGMRSVAVDHHDTIMNFLDVGFTGASHPGDVNLIAANHASQQQPVSEICVELGSLKPSSRLYEVQHEGALASVVLNKFHPFVEDACVDGNLSTEAKRIIGVLLVALETSLENVAGTDLTTPRIVIEQLEFDFDKNTKLISRQSA